VGVSRGRAPGRAGTRALVVGCGLGYDAEFLANDPDPERDASMMPWALTRRELELAGGPLRLVTVEQFFDDEDPPKLRWRAEFRREEFPFPG
jgi:hypothetical protein